MMWGLMLIKVPLQPLHPSRTCVPKPATVIVTLKSQIRFPKQKFGVLVVSRIGFAFSPQILWPVDVA